MPSATENFFLCSFCGLKIMSNLTNLKRHEKLHQDLVKRVKCAAENCGSTFARKQTYYNHWKTAHQNIRMPDGLHFVVEPSKVSAKRIFKVDAAQNESGDDQPIEIPIDFAILHAVGLIQNVEIKVKDVMGRCLNREPFFGQMKLKP